MAQANSTELTAQRISIMSPKEFQELEPIAAALNAESNEINSVIAALNAKLAALMSVWRCGSLQTRTTSCPPMNFRNSNQSPRL